ncbi:MAG: transposase [Chloroflexi bacterium]|nr:transposase [Chloroflexota bacterium]
MKAIHHQHEVKKEAVRQWLQGEKRTAQVCREYQIDRTTLWRWSQLFSQEELPGVAHLSSSRPDPLVERLERVESQYEQLSMELHLLKKALAGLQSRRNTP